MYPLKFEPVFKDYIWGGKNLIKIKDNIPLGRIAESWEISCHPEGISVVSNGEYKGTSLIEIIKAHRREILGDLDSFSLLIKLIDAEKRLSVQVHPDDSFAQKYENEKNGKNELWYIISAKKDADIIYGLKRGMTKQGFKKCIEKGEIEESLNYIKAFSGDTIYISSGIIHAIGSGIIIAEIQQSSNLTYRVYDYDRVDSLGKKRTLHIEKALRVIDFNTPRKERYPGITVPLTGLSSKSIKAITKYFCVELYNVLNDIDERPDYNRFSIYLIIEGQGEVIFPSGSVAFKHGETVMIPACIDSYRLSGRFKALKTYIPKKEDIIHNLIKKGYSIEDIIDNIAGALDEL